MKKNLKGKPFLICAGIMCLICIVRGLAYRYLWKIGTFMEGAVYPFVLFTFISVLILPLYILNKKYGICDEDEEKSMNQMTKALEEKKASGCLFFVFRGVLLIALFLVLVFGVPVFLDRLYFVKDRIHTDNYLMALPACYIYLVAAMFLMILLYWMNSSLGLFYDIETGETGLKCYLPRRIKIRVGIMAVIVYLLSVGLYVSCYDVMGDDGFTRKRLSREMHYEYEDVAYYQIYAQHDGTLGYKLFFSDGTDMKVYRALSSESLDESLYPNGEEDYLIEMSKRFADRGIKLRIVNEKKLMKNLTYDYWDDVGKKIIEVSIIE